MKVIEKELQTYLSSVQMETAKRILKKLTKTVKTMD